MSTAATPNWLSSETAADSSGGGGLEPAAATASAASAPATGSATTTGSGSISAAGAGATAPAAAADAAEDADLPGVILTMRLANMGVAVALIAIAVRLRGVLRTKRRMKKLDVFLLSKIFPFFGESTLNFFFSPIMLAWIIATFIFSHFSRSLSLSYIYCRL
jgi:hypothetical protein